MEPGERQNKIVEARPKILPEPLHSLYGPVLNSVKNSKWWVFKINYRFTPKEAH
jgi:hypothetical protein